jgi:hypothetical protein
VANYTKSTNFAVKDGLPSGDPLKVVKGTEIDTEFNNIATAVTSKADISGPTFLGTPFAPTASAGTSTNQIATTAFVTTAIQALYPVGSVYINATSSTNPGTLLGFGTWVAFGAGRVMVGFNASDPLFDAAEETGGSKDAIVVSHTHTATVTDPGHAHNTTFGYSTDVNYFGNNVPFYGPINTGVNGNQTVTSASNTTGITVSNSTEGSSGTNANLQPYITVYMWKRTA